MVMWITSIFIWLRIGTSGGEHGNAEKFLSNFAIGGYSRRTQLHE
jgi:hypothetical protein